MAVFAAHTILKVTGTARTQRPLLRIYLIACSVPQRTTYWLKVGKSITLRNEFHSVRLLSAESADMTIPIATVVGKSEKPSHISVPNAENGAQKTRDNSSYPSIIDHNVSSVKEKQNKGFRGDSVLIRALCEAVKVGNSAREAAAKLTISKNRENSQEISLIEYVKSKFDYLNGYSQVEALKNSIIEQEQNLIVLKDSLKSMKEEAERLNLQHAAVQKEINDLLLRRPGWTDTDVSKFTRLVETNHGLDMQEAGCKRQINTTEAQVEDAQNLLMKDILERYHEEQVWSDKTRHLSAWSSYGLMIINIILFLIVQLLLEPWKRHRMQEAFQGSIETIIEESSRKQAEEYSAMMSRLDSEGISTKLTTGLKILLRTSFNFLSRTLMTINDSFNEWQILSKITRFWEGVKYTIVSSTKRSAAEEIR